MTKIDDLISYIEEHKSVGNSMTFMYMKMDTL